MRKLTKLMGFNLSNFRVLGKRFYLFLYVIVLVTFSVVSFADQEGRRDFNYIVKFPKGTSTAQITKSAPRGEYHNYILSAKQGQRMTIFISALESNAVFQIKSPKNIYLSKAGEEDDAKSWDGILPSTGSYTISVSGDRGNANYKLRISIKAINRNNQ